jgi:eukaryotic-like serine/threonine-protein kinase
MIGTTVSHYRILEAIGSGGMGVVYLAEDLRLHRKVALKFLHETAAYGAEAQERLLREAQAEGTLDHPNIATVYEIGEWQGRTFIAMAYYPGETLKQRLEGGPLALDDVVNLAAQIAAGLEAAHAAGIVHRDLKPANIIITTNGQVKILDFGLAKELSKAEAETKLRITTSGTTVGTIAYMAPEQALGQTVDQRADIWAFGALLFEMVTGRVPYQGATAAAVLLSIVSDTAPPVSTFRADVPAPLQQVIASALARRQEDRTITVDEIAATLAGLREPRGVGSAPTSASRPRARAAIVAVIGIAAIALTAGGWFLKRQADTRRFQTTGIAEIRRLAANGEFFQAFARARASSGVAADDAELARLRSDISRPLSIVSNPPGADVSIATYGSGAPAWIRLGETPLTESAIPRGIVRLRLVKDGYTVSEDLLMVYPVSAITLSVELTKERATPQGMVRVNGPERPVPSYLAPGSDPVDVIFRDYWLDRYEVTNRQFKAFVDAGGYQRREFWRHDFVRDGKPVRWEDAMASFRDATGRQGPATWQVGAYPEGQGDYPVTGVSWYEAEAYARFAGKSLPTLPHFLAVAGRQFAAVIVPVANFGGKGIAQVGTTAALSGAGAYDLAGNVKEWLVNPAGGDLRYIAGGAWDEPSYMFTEPDARAAFERAANFGFRCARYDAGDPSPAALGGLVERANRDYAAEKPVPDPVFEAYRRFFAYDHTPVKATVTASYDGNPEWRVESVSYPAAYGGETILARLFLPRNSKPPYQTVVYQSGAGQWNLRTSPPLPAVPPFASVMRSGRAVIYPIVKGTFERGTDQFTSTTAKDSTLWRDYTVAYYKDLARTLDYLATRPDTDKDRIAFFGLSRGAALSPIPLALEPQRIKAAVLLIPGFYLSRQPPEVDIINFLPRVTQPVLMLSGRYDFIFPEQRSSLPFFSMLGTAADRKRRVAYDSGHNVPQAEQIKETLDWLDRYLGPVARQ